MNTPKRTLWLFAGTALAAGFLTTTTPSQVALADAPTVTVTRAGPARAVAERKKPPRDRAAHAVRPANSVPHAALGRKKPPRD